MTSESINSLINSHYTEESGLKIHNTLHAFIVGELLPESGVEESVFWQSFARIVEEFSPRNKDLLKKRDEMQAALDQWHKDNSFDFHAYKSFLKSIDYLVEEGESFSITTTKVDEEIALQAGPQLVVPVMNARFALNACNARWGSLYDALYGTDVIAPQSGDENPGYNPARGEKVVAYGREFLDTYFPLSTGSFSAATGFKITGESLTVLLGDGAAQLVSSEQWCGYSGSAEAPTAILLVNNGLHVEIQIDKDHPIGKTDSAGIKDIVLEAALTTIMDCEDSVAAVDAADKTLVYRNWLGLMRGDLEETVQKGGREFVRRMNPDKTFAAPDGSELTLPGRSLMFVRNVGHLMTNPAVLTKNGEEVPEGIMDGVITTVCAMHNMNSKAQLKNSRTGSIYIVKPKMHGPEEVAFTDALFAQIESAFGLADNTLKVGIMDEERRTSVNLKECIRAAQSRVAFINTGFLDRTGDEIHTSMHAGAFAPKDQLKAMPWIQAYELSNVATGLACGLKGRAQIGKGMWAMPDNMAAMMKAKIAQPKAGANTAWVPSPTAATLHAMHYHAVNVADVQAEMSGNSENYLDTILQVPLLAQDAQLNEQDIQRELENNAQGILGYVVRWIDLGVGCSKVPDITDTALMEDRATLRISSQHLSNWLFHGICTEEQVLAVMERMAAVVDKQNASDPAYTPMCEDLENSVAFAAAKDLVFKGMTQPNGYTEPLLHAYRLQKKS